MTVEQLQRARGVGMNGGEDNATWGDKRKASPYILPSLPRNLHNFRNLTVRSSSQGGVKSKKKVNCNLASLYTMMNEERKHVASALYR